MFGNQYNTNIYVPVNKIKNMKPVRKRLFNKLKDMTPACQSIYKEFVKAKQQNNYYKRAQKALKFQKDKCFEKLTKNMNPYGKKILKMQINLCTKQKKGYRFSTEEKLIALSIMKQSHKCYKRLRQSYMKLLFR